MFSFFQKKIHNTIARQSPTTRWIFLLLRQVLAGFFETAKQLLEFGHRVYIVNRIQKKTEDTVKALMRFGKVEKAGDCMGLEDFA